MNQRPDLYISIHKGLRAAMLDQLGRLGRLDLSDPTEVKGVLTDLADLLTWMAEHLHIEEEFVHKELEKRRPNALLASLRHNHDDHERAFALLKTDAAALESALGEDMQVRHARAHHLYLEFSRFVGENLVHMALEETDMNALLREVFAPAELAAIFGRIVASERPEQLMRSIRWVVPALRPDERAMLIGGVRGSIVPEVFEALLTQLAMALPANDWDKLSRALTVSAAS